MQISHTLLSQYIELLHSTFLKGELVSILNETEVETLKGMAIYWLEVSQRDNQVERDELMSGELRQVIHLLGAEKVLFLIAEHVKSLSNK